MAHKSHPSPELFLAVVAAGLLLLTNDTYGVQHDNFSPSYRNGTQTSFTDLRRVKRRVQPQNGFFFPIAMYTVRHHKPSNNRGVLRPESWEYRGQYFYGYRPRPSSGRRRAARLLAAGLPLLLAPLLSIIFSFPVVVPVAQMTAITTGASLPPSLGQFSGAAGFGRKRKRRNVPHGFSPEKASRMKELEVVANYLHQVDYDEKQQSRVMVNYLQCNGLLSSDDHCLERLSCEFGDPANEHAPELERTVTSILFGHMLNNEFIPKPFKKRLKLSTVYGRNNSGSCNKYFCNYVDNNWDYTSMYPPQGGHTHFHEQDDIPSQKL